MAGRFWQSVKDSVKTPKNPWAPPGPDDDVYILDVTEAWYNNQHSYWAFREGTWYRWALTGEGPVPTILETRNKRDRTATLSRHPTATERTLYVYYGGIMGFAGAYLGAERAEVDAWLAGRIPLGTLEVIEDPPPEDMVPARHDEPPGQPGPGG